MVCKLGSYVLDTVPVAFPASSFKGEGADREEGRFTCLLSDMGASCQPQWYYSILQGMHCIVDTARHCRQEVKSSQVMLASEEREQLNGMLFTYVYWYMVFYCVQVYSNNFEVAALHPNQTSFTLTELTPGTLYLISVGAFTDAGEGEREERMIKTDGSTATPTGMTHCMHALVVYCKQCPISSAWCPVSS